MNLPIQLHNRIDGARSGSLFKLKLLIHLMKIYLHFKYIDTVNTFHRRLFKILCAMIDVSIDNTIEMYCSNKLIKKFSLKS